MILVALKTAFWGFQIIVIALDDLSVNLPILQALPSFFESSQEEPATLERCGNRAFRFGLLLFACDLTSLLEKIKSCEDYFSIMELRHTTIYLRRIKSSFEGTLSKLNELYLFFDDFTMDTSYGQFYSFVQPFVTELASECATAGWFHEAETLFAVLRSSQSLEVLGPFSQQKFEISKRYCLYLKRNKRYAELLSEICDTYTHLENYHTSGKSVPLHDAYYSAALLNNLPLPYDQYVSSEKAREIGRLEILFSRPVEFSVHQISNINSAMSFDVSFQHNLVFERNKNKAMDEDELIEDCKSSNKFGVTYTESGMTGISFNYSDLYK
jgi:hypothetical protein